MPELQRGHAIISCAAYYNLSVKTRQDKSALKEETRHGIMIM